jgi:hypothetical protein
MIGEPDVEGPPAGSAYKAGFVVAPISALAFISSGMRSMEDDKSSVFFYVGFGIGVPLVVLLFAALSARPRKRRTAFLRQQFPDGSVVNVIVSGARDSLDPSGGLRRVYTISLMARRGELTFWKGGADVALVAEMLASATEITAGIGRHAGSAVSVLRIRSSNLELELPVVDDKARFNTTAGGRWVVSSAQRLRERLGST